MDRSCELGEVTGGERIDVGGARAALRTRYIWTTSLGYLKFSGCAKW